MENFIVIYFGFVKQDKRKDQVSNNPRAKQQTKNLSCFLVLDIPF